MGTPNEILIQKTDFCVKRGVVSHRLFVSSDRFFSARMPRTLYSLFNNLCTTGIIWGDNLGCRMLPLNMNTWTKNMQMSLAFLQPKHLHTDVSTLGVLHQEGGGSAWSMHLYSTLCTPAPSREQPLFPCYEGYTTAPSPPLPSHHWFPCRKILNTLLLQYTNAANTRM